MAVLMISFLLLMVLGCPIAFCLLCSGTLYFMVNDMALFMVVQRLTEGANTFTLLAVPGFILAGNLMNSGEVTDRIFDFCGKLVGHVTGGLGHANILASVVFAGMSGAAIADAGGLGAIELKAMRDAGYDDDFSLAVTGASSLVGPIIPPSCACGCLRHSGIGVHRPSLYGRRGAWGDHGGCHVCDGLHYQ